MSIVQVNNSRLVLWEAVLFCMVGHFFPKMSTAWNFKAENISLEEKKKHHQTPYFVTLNLPSAFPCFVSVYPTLEQTEKELDPNLSQMLSCSCFLCHCMLFFFPCYFYSFINRSLFYCILSPLCFLVALFLSLWFIIDTCLTSLSVQNNSSWEWACELMEEHLTFYDFGS